MINIVSVEWDREPNVFYRVNRKLEIAVSIIHFSFEIPEILPTYHEFGKHM